MISAFVCTVLIILISLAIWMHYMNKEIVKGTCKKKNVGKETLPSYAIHAYRILLTFDASSDYVTLPIGQHENDACIAYLDNILNTGRTVSMVLMNTAATVRSVKANKVYLSDGVAALPGDMITTNTVNIPLMKSTSGESVVATVFVYIA